MTRLSYILFPLAVAIEFAIEFWIRTVALTIVTVTTEEFRSFRGYKKCETGHSDRGHIKMIERT